MPAIAVIGHELLEFWRPAARAIMSNIQRIF
jgi:hypothetical protein